MKTSRVKNVSAEKNGCSGEGVLVKEFCYKIICDFLKDYFFDSAEDEYYSNGALTFLFGGEALIPKSKLYYGRSKI